MENKFYITTPIYYVNASPHIGHTYTTLAADALARYHRLAGDRTYFAAGTDEHGAKIAQKAGEAGIEPQEFADRVAAEFELAWDEMNISHDRFIRTTEPAHIKAVQKALQYMYDKGDIYKDEYEGLYCVGCEQFKSEKDLVNGKCPDHQTAPEKMKEETYMFKMSKYADELLDKIKKDELKIRPLERKNEVVSFYENEGLKDVSFSRQKISWGIPLPWDASHTAYVWSDAFLNYLTVLDWDGSGRDHPDMFPPDLQLMSKDILRVHATIWPAMLLSLGLPLMKQIFVHGYFLIDSQKMSKSLGNVIAPADLAGRYGTDAGRYLLLSSAVFGRDGDITRDKLDEKYTADLANGLGNLVSRSVVLTDKLYQAGLKMPDCVARPDDKARLEKWGGQEFAGQVEDNWKNYRAAMEDIGIDKALEVIIEEARFLDNYITENEPWKLIKKQDGKAAVIMYNILERLRHLALMLWPFMPETAEEVWRQLGLKPDRELAKEFNEQIKFGLLPANPKVCKGRILFPRLPKEEQGAGLISELAG